MLTFMFIISTYECIPAYASVAVLLSIEKHLYLDYLHYNMDRKTFTNILNIKL